MRTLQTFTISFLSATSIALLAPSAFAQAVEAQAQGAPAAAPSPMSSPPPDQPAAPANRATMHGATSAFLGLGYGYGFATGLGVGARFQWVFLPDGLMKFNNGMHDEMGVEAGLDFFHAGYSQDYGGEQVSWSYNEFTPVVGLTWNFWLSDKFAVYPKIDLGYRIASWSESVNGSSTGSTTDPAYSALYFQGAGGVIYKAGPVALRAEIGWEALRLGAGINL